ncbi:zinc ribbon domain-containing protein [Bifidobacterium pullorum]|uniref:zinc ribbon domain-containing protein n=1 Tax=Bifidobacterium pullorum TaxID=78448 RepID=UPI000AEC95CD|nr:zinc ribbon domain-containing protein [Bifidobacterium pullorum]
MQCPNCGSPIDEANKFCTNCGAGIPDRDGSATSTSAQGNGIDGAEPGRKRRRRLIIGIIAAVVAVALVAVAAVMVVPRLLNGTGGADSTADRDVVYYGSSKAMKVRPSTTIVLYGDDGKPLDEYDVTVMDESGEVTTAHVSDGEFTPNRVGAESGGTYSVIARDPDGALLDVPDLTVVDQEKTNDEPNGNAPGKDSDTDEEQDGTVHDELEVKPEPDSGNDPNGSDNPDKNDDQTSNARRTAYALFYDTIRKLRNQYGEGQLVQVNQGLVGTYLSGLGDIRLIDFDGDGIEELLVAYLDDSDSSATRLTDWKLQIWQYEKDKSTLALTYDNRPCAENNSSAPGTGWVGVGVAHTETPMLYGWDYGQNDGLAHEQIVHSDGGAMNVTDFARPASSGDSDASDVWYVNGRQTDHQTYEGSRDSLGLNDNTSYEYDWLSVTNTDWASSPNVEFTLPDDVLTRTERTIEDIKQGMMNGFTDTNDELSDEVSASKAAYADKVNELQQQYGTGMITGSYNEWLHGLVAAVLVDFNSDGVDELLTAVNTGDSSSFETSQWMVNVWEFDQDSRTLDSIYTGEPGGSNGGYVFLELRTYDDGSTVLYAPSLHSSHGDCTVFSYDADGPKTTTYARDGNTDHRQWMRDGEPLSDAEYEADMQHYDSASTTTRYTLAQPLGDADQPSCESTRQITDETIASLNAGTKQ